MAFDVQGALKEGYSPNEIADYLGAQKKFDVNGARKEGYSDDEIIGFLNPKQKTGFTGAVQKGVEQAGSTAQTAYESIVGSPEAAVKAGAERQKAAEEKYDVGTSLQKVKDIYNQPEGGGILPAAKEIVTNIPEAIGEQVGPSGSIIAGSMLGARMAGLPGALVGAFGPSYVQQYGGMLQRQAQEQEAAGQPVNVNRLKAAVYAAPAAVLDVAGTLIPFGGKLASKVFGPEIGQLLAGGSKEAAEKLAKETLLTTVAKGTAGTVLAEIPTEVAQSMLERANANLPLLDEKAFAEYGETAFDVSLLGPLGILGRVSNKGAAREQVLQAQQEAAKANEPKPISVPLDDGTTATGIVDPDGTIKSTTTEAYATPGDKEAIEAARWAEARKNSPTMQKLDEIVTKKQQMIAEQNAKIDQMKAAQSAFTNAPMEGGVIRPPSAEQIAAEQAKADSYANRVTVAAQENGRVNIYEGEMNPSGKTINVVDPATGLKKTFNPKQKNIVVDPTEKDIFAFEEQGLTIDLKNLDKEIKDAEKSVSQKATNFEEWIKKNPIKESDIADVLPNALEVRSGGKGTKIAAGARKFFSKNGSPIDDLALRAVEDGVMTQEELDNPGYSGGTNAFLSKLEAAYNKETIETPENRDAIAEITTLYNQKEQLEQEIERKKSLAAAPTEEEIGMAQAPEFVAPEPATPAEAVTPAEYTQRQPVTPSTNISPTGQQMFEVPYEFSEQAKRDMDKIIPRLTKTLDKMGLHTIGLNLAKNLKANIDGKITKVNGTYLNRIITLCLDNRGIEATLHHEAIHALKEMGMFSQKEWNTLSKIAKDKWIDQYNINTRYPNATEEVKIEEAIASAFPDYMKQVGQPRGLLQRIKDFVQKVGNVFRGLGFNTPESVFAKAEAGQLTGEGVSVQPSTTVKAEVANKVRSPMEGVDQDYADLIRKTFSQQPATIKERMDGLKTNFFDKMITGLFDEFRAIKKYNDPSAYMAARLSKSIDGALQGLLEHGEVFNDGGALNIRKDTKGLLEIYAPLGKEVDQYQIWKALSRDSQLPADKRSFPAEAVAGRDKLVAGNLNGKPRQQLYEQIRAEEQKLNESVLKVALDTGLIDQEGYDKFSKDIYYIPFYKQMEGGDVGSVSASSKLTGQYFSKALKGGEKPVNDLMENVLLNWSHILSAAMKNQAAVKTLDAAAKMGAVERATPMDGKYPPNTVKVMEKGKTVHYTLSDPDLVDAISSISYLGPKSAFLDVAKGFTNALRYGITLNPAYKIRNLIRDSVQSVAVSGISPNFAANIFNGFAMSKDGHPTYAAALAGGGIFEMGTAHEGNQAKLIKNLIERGVNQAHILDTPEKIKGFLPMLLEKYNHFGNRFEHANRLALYDQLIKSGKSHLEASYAARDLMDFSMQGQFRAIKIIGSVVPFFNARLQGLYKLGRDGISPTYRVICNATTGKPLQIGDEAKALRFTAMTSAVMMASTLLYGMYKDDEDFKRREDWDRDNFWWFKVGDTAFRIPKPFEIGAAGTLAERTYEQMVDDSVEGKVFFKRMHAILMDNFSMDLRPQMFKPMLDIYANKDSFTGAPIESAGMERLSKQERINSGTSGLAIALGGISSVADKILTFDSTAEGLSPVQMDYLIRGYFGWMGTTAAAIADEGAVESFTGATKVRPPVVDRLAMGFIKTEPETRSKYMTSFYENNARIQSALADMRHYAELGEAEKVQKIMEEKGDDIGLAKTYDKTTKQLALMRKQMRFIEAEKDIPTEDKRAEMNRLKILMSDMASQIEDMRKQLKK